MSKVEGKFVRLFGHSEIHLTACAVIKNPNLKFLLWASEYASHYFEEPNQFWQRDPNHERALLKVYKRNLEENQLLTCLNNVQTVEIPMTFLGNNSADGWGELQFLIKQPTAVKLARQRSFDTRVNRWVEETKTIQPKTDLGTHAYLALRFYHQDYLPPVPGDWRFEPAYVSIKNSDFYKIDVLWEQKEMTVTVTKLSKDSPEIPKHLK
ncbi:hypothetical protein A2819_02065 [Candidatus Azambacteria bacterium RIFCSPHIGHO2_01_FULL_40_24]|uniref:Uncharacterized protein n=1 Tax=Candidatus Azambacteria bacterium RIFCSPHIGHO2_01_FULL_40_24 TaxID=1797301 RepID=A0A1F5B4J0_9BACT|nr:MAG: hypothetical protein A2819_02065 [Candidatus Azambacteria bacterium RIFCSPHIGHO2_01_FULL_40_24]